MTKKFRPLTPGQRRLVLPTFTQLTPAKVKRKIPKDLVKKKTRICGRNNYGRITCFHRGGGHKRKFRQVDFLRRKDDIPAKVASIEYDPNRSAHIALIYYRDGEKRFILAPQDLKAGDIVISGKNTPFEVGCCMPLKNMPVGSVIHNIELYPGRGAKLVRSAGLSAQLIARSGGYVTIRMPSGEVRMIQEECRATFGIVSNPEHNLRVEGKAGRVRWRGVRPTVRGTAMNPVDHPHGGGEGKSKGNHPQTPWAEYTKGRKTRKKRKKKNYLVKERKK